MSVQILQLSDLHLLADPGEELKGVCTRDSLIEVLKFVRQGEAAGKWDFDWVVLTGDFTHDERRETYLALRELLEPWLQKCRLVPGNHDDRALIREVFPELVTGDGSTINFSLAAGNWRLIGLDSHLPGEVRGRIDSEQFEWLSEQLAANAEQATALFVHHPPVSVNSAWLDAIGLEGSEQLQSIVQSHPQVRVVCTGHVHQEFRTEFGSAEVLTTPSTSVQFQPETEELVVDNLAPGFRILRLLEDGFETEVVRAGGH